MTPSGVKNSKCEAYKEKKKFLLKLGTTLPLQPHPFFSLLVGLPGCLIL